MSDKPIIEVKNLSKLYKIGMDTSYKRFSESTVNFIKSPVKTIKSIAEGHENFYALNNISFDVEKGEVIGIIGKNGAGKSTILKVLSGITYPTNGRVILRGRTGSLLEVGTGFHPELTGRENIFFNGAILGMRKTEIEEKFDDIVKFAGVEKFLDTPVKRFSSGMHVRLAFSVAAHLDPEILLVDEVLAVGDLAFQKKCIKKMEGVSKEGKTVLLVSHNMAQINKLCDRTIVLNNGNLIFNGPTNLAIENYTQSTQNSNINILDDINLASKDKSIQLRNIRIYGDNESDPIITGKNCHIYLKFEFKEKILNPAFIVSIRSNMDIELMRFSTYPLSSVSIGKCEGTVKAILKIDELNLAGGTYSIAVGVSYPNIKYIIPITEVCQFDVKSIDFYNSGYLVNNNIGFFVSRNSWEIMPDDGII